MRNALVAVSMGDKYNKNTERMIKNFKEHHPEWDIIWYYDSSFDAILPNTCRSWSPFNKCELGRFFALKETLKKHEHVLYCDGDMAWYSEFKTSDHSMTLFPHYVTKSAKRIAQHWLWLDGIPNIGLIEMSMKEDSNDLLDFIIEEVLHNPKVHMGRHGDKLWLQNISSCLPECGYDCVYNLDPGINVARWNIQRGDRVVIMKDDRLTVRTNEGQESPLVSFHFSEKSINTLYKYGDVVSRLTDDYLSR